MSVLLKCVGVVAAVSSVMFAVSHSGSPGLRPIVERQREPATAVPAGVPAAPVPLTAAEREFYQDMARTALTYMNANYQPTTGLVNATPDWHNTTLWDIGGQLLAFHAAKEMGLLAPEEYDLRTRKALATLSRASLVRKAAFSKIYSTTTGSPDNEGRGAWSATDLGRFLVALKIIAVREPQHAALAEAVARRNDFSQIVKDGYLHGQLIGSNGKPWTFQEGRIGYEQYAASGFALWGANVGNAMAVQTNAQPVDVLGVPLVADKRYDDRLLSEPFILYGLELGMPNDVRSLAANVLRAQEARFKQTGVMTIVSEDAVGVPPEYFYYYCVYCGRKPFVIDLSTPGKTRDTPRWVSTKAAFGWHALMPNEYTSKAIALVSTARDAKRGWASGVYERGGSTDTFDINTAAVLLEIAYFQLRGAKPLMESASPAGP